jgi:hypothetical protein
MNEHKAKNIPIRMASKLRSLAKAYDKVYEIQYQCRELKKYMSEDDWDDFCFKYSCYFDFDVLLLDIERITSKKS